MAAEAVACPACRHNNPSGSRFCNACGSRLSVSQPGPIALLPGDVLGAAGRYRIERSIGKGGFGQAFLAMDTQLGRYCVVKMMALHPSWDVSTRANATSNFRREAELLVSLNTPGHPNIPEIYEFLPDESCLVMKYIEGKDLGGVIAEYRQGLPVEEVLPLIRDICAALVYMHEHSAEPVLHRDIKPSNILIDRSGRAWLIDFGLSKATAATALTPAAASNNATQVGGTFGYSPHEQWRGQAEARSDVYALAASLHTLLTGYQPPYDVADLKEILQGKKGAFPPLRRLKPELSPALESLILRSMHYDVQQRPTAAVFLAELETIMRPAGSLVPIQAPDGSNFTTERELVAWAEQHWNAAADWLCGDLADQIDRSWGRKRLAEDLRALLKSHSQETHAALDAALALCDPQDFGQARPRLSTDKHMLNFGGLAADQRSECSLNLLNSGRRFIRAQVRPPGWVVVSSLQVALAPGQQQRLTLAADMRRAPGGGRLQDDLLIEDRSQLTFRVKLRATVSGWKSFWNRLGANERSWMAGNVRTLRVLRGHTAGVWCLAFLPDSSGIVSGSWDHSVRFWQTANGAPGPVWQAHNGNVLAVAVSADGYLCASASADESVVIWSIPERRQLLRLSDAHSYIGCVTFSPDGSLLLGGGGERKLMIWRTRDGNRIRTLSGHSGSVTAALYSPDGNYIVSAGAEGAIGFWRSSDGGLAQMVRSEDGGVNVLAFSPDGYMLASGGADGSVRLWHIADLLSGRGGTLRPIILSGDETTVRAVAFHPHGDVLASGGLDGTIRLWRLRDACEIECLHGHSSAILALAFSPDGRMLASSGGDGTIRLWAPGAPGIRE